jgi:hypothetical protein
VQPIWRGSISNFNHAVEFLAIVDQIHNYAITTHRDMVKKHLEPWLRRAESDLANQDTSIKWSYRACMSKWFRWELLEKGFFTSSKIPRWKELQVAATAAQSLKRSKTSNLNRAKKIAAQRNRRQELEETVNDDTELRSSTGRVGPRRRSERIAHRNRRKTT